ncbi:MAG: hypothetical protein PWP07_10 [Epulopiscium sp.]|jgi:hypothetical protein|uniref:Uncharacterized protein n=1 Tax=Defluviitalea raffinosedens TaxID=1450156 RepID=A0A7C8HHF3_9FIRM|nr:hypothetical protein [Defluviitalea raffinosedens]MBZ4666979.1 hypothetical protein [Defluviitaleaceae bacterium]MDK2786785.1 hypothetical protein [Candidatus Epulonipiscium sp.]KAE9635658.1 hypothetical protein GND95_05805 [Defluviitalea raffinosedens]MBM7684583.1 hypothetical protein [Defluviitalea raffinosedens]HHW68316.1 hypothetical protein [Candidatus Epulonipiscium sp.]
MKKFAQAALIGLLAVMVMLAGCSGNNTARNTRNNDGLYDNGVTDRNANDWDDNIMGYDDTGNTNRANYNTDNDVDLMPGDENVFDGDLNDDEDNVRRGITTQIQRTLPGTTNRTITGTTNRIINRNTTGTTTRNTTGTTGTRGTTDLSNIKGTTGKNNISGGAGITTYKTPTAGNTPNTRTTTTTTRRNNLTTSR